MDGLDDRLRLFAASEPPGGFDSRMDELAARITSGPARPGARAPLSLGIAAIAGSALVGLVGAGVSSGPAYAAASPLQPEVALAPSTLLDDRRR
ncbi:hypothetical protein [uncultured Sphingomonas sp.]|uniref:hypothetical protein n=1 Tax=uncultured Sphingomonas sp. TaxID=158754 RepID=UPI0025FD6628|nr:hypothetical protein [uncultured Sphingomonas sp.]